MATSIESTPLDLSPSLESTSSSSTSRLTTENIETLLSFPQPTRLKLLATYLNQQHYSQSRRSKHYVECVYDVIEFMNTSMELKDDEDDVKLEKVCLFVNDVYIKLFESAFEGGEVVDVEGMQKGFKKLVLECCIAPSVADGNEVIESSPQADASSTPSLSPSHPVSNSPIPPSSTTTTTTTTNPTNSPIPPSSPSSSTPTTTTKKAKPTFTPSEIKQLTIYTSSNLMRNFKLFSFIFNNDAQHTASSEKTKEAKVVRIELEIESPMRDEDGLPEEEPEVLPGLESEVSPELGLEPEV